MFEIIFVNKETGAVEWAVTQVTEIQRITLTEVSYKTAIVDTIISFPYTENLEIKRI